MRRKKKMHGPGALVPIKGTVSRVRGGECCWHVATLVVAAPPPLFRAARALVTNSYGAAVPADSGPWRGVRRPSCPLRVCGETATSRGRSSVFPGLRPLVVLAASSALENGLSAGPRLSRA